MFCFAVVHKLTGKPNSLYDAADGDEDSKYLLAYFSSSVTSVLLAIMLSSRKLSCSM